jgi:hypothetical protein
MGASRASSRRSRAGCAKPGFRRRTSSDIGLIVATHGHWDHIGCLAEMKEYTGAPLAMHAADRRSIEAPNPVMPPVVTPWGVRRAKAALSSGCKPRPATAPAGSNRSRHGGDEMLAAKPTSAIVLSNPQVRGLGDLYAARMPSRSAADVPLSQSGMPTRRPRPWSGMRAVDAAARLPLEELLAI